MMNPAPEMFGLRERKAAATRLAIARAMSARLTSRSLSEITVDELAEAAGISRMTFFNYFPTKEHVLDHIFSTWAYEEQAASRQRGLEGVDKILHVFERFGALTAESPRRARQVLSWFAGRPLDRPWGELPRADRELIAPGHGEAPLRTGRDWLPEAIAEARRLGEITSPSSDYVLGHLLGVLLFGIPLVGHSEPAQDWPALYRHHARHALGLDTRDAKTRRGSGAKKKTPRAKKGGTR